AGGVKSGFSVSTHAPAWGATGWSCIGRGTPIWFQLTRPRGARRGNKYMMLRGMRVSTHAPAWGATGNPAEKGGKCMSFNSRARVGRDLRHPAAQVTQPDV